MDITIVTVFDDRTGDVIVPLRSGDAVLSWYLEDGLMVSLTDAAKCELAENVDEGEDAEEIATEAEDAVAKHLTDNDLWPEPKYCDICDSPMTDEDYEELDGLCSNQCRKLEGRGDDEV